MQSTTRWCLNEGSMSSGGFKPPTPWSRSTSQTSFTASVGSAVKQIPHRFDACTGRNCGRFQTAVSRLRGDAEIGFELSLPPARGQAGCAAPVDEARPENWHSCADALCTHFATRPPRRRSSSDGTLEQRTGQGHLNRLKTLKCQMYGRAGIKTAPYTTVARVAYSWTMRAPKTSQNPVKCQKGPRNRDS